MHFRFLGSKFREDTAQAQRLLAQCRTHPLGARGRRIAFVKNQIDHFEYGSEPRCQFVRSRHFERYVRLAQSSFGAHDSLCDRRLGHQERAGYLCRGQAPQQAQRERHPRLGGQHRMTRSEYEAQQIVLDIVIGYLVRRRGFGGEQFGLLRDDLMLALQEFEAAQLIKRAVLGGYHQPGSRVAWDTGFGPLLERGHQRILCQLLGKSHVAQHSREFRNDFGRFHSPDCLDGAFDVGLNHG